MVVSTFWETLTYSLQHRLRIVHILSHCEDSFDIVLKLRVEILSFLGLKFWGMDSRTHKYDITDFFRNKFQCDFHARESDDNNPKCREFWLFFEFLYPNKYYGKFVSPEKALHVC